MPSAPLAGRRSGAISELRLTAPAIAKKRRHHCQTPWDTITQ
jgi:hypothetical protein